MDIVSFSFANQGYDEDEPLYLDATQSERCISAKESRVLVRKLVAGFRFHGLLRGDCVCVVSLNDIHYTSLYLGIIGAGGIFTGANPGYTSRELIRHFTLTKAKFLLTEQKTLATTMAAAEECGIPISNIFVLNYRAELLSGADKSWFELQNCGESDWVQVKDPASTTAVYASTSGTSGLPKATIIPHTYLASQAAYLDTFAAVSYGLSSLLAIPPFHAFAMPFQHAFPLRFGVPTYIMTRFEETSFVKALNNHRISLTAVVPAIVMTLSKIQDPPKLESLRRVLCAGSVATNSLQQKLYAKLSPDARIEQVYGMTEVGWVTHWQAKGRDTTGSIGHPLPNSQLRLDTQPTTSSSTSTTSPSLGEIQILVPFPMLGYLDNPAATSEAFTPDGWIRSGDIGYVENNNWHIVGRNKELMKVRGWQVSPAELESLLLECEGVKDVGVVGVLASDGSGEVPVAFIVRTPAVVSKEWVGGDVTPNGRDKKGGVTADFVKEFVNTRLARYKSVHEFRFAESIPKNAMGKIVRSALRVLYAAGSGSAVDGTLAAGSAANKA